MRLLLDTHLLLWAAGQPDRLSVGTRDLLEAPQNVLVYSVASLWEIGIKQALGRDDFRVDARALLRALRDNLYEELPVLGVHAIALDTLPPLHKDPFDRMLIAQAMTEGLTLLTTDAVVARYPGPIRLV